MGAGHFAADVNPFKGGSRNDQTGDLVEFEIDSPTALDGPFGTPLIQQEVRLTITAPKEHVLELADTTLARLADILSLGSEVGVTRHVGSLTNAPWGVTEGANYQTILPMTPLHAVGPSNGLTIRFFNHFAREIGDVDGKRARYIIRSMRWLRRSYTADDGIAEFTALAFALNSLVALLPDPPQDPASKEPEGRPTANAKMTHWAVERAGVPAERWRRAGDLRDKIAHGGLAEDSRTLAAAREAAPYVRLAVQSALKHLLNLPAEAPPTLVLPLRIDVTSIEVGGVAMTQPPNP